MVVVLDPPRCCCYYYYDRALCDVIVAVSQPRVSANVSPVIGASPEKVIFRLTFMTS